MTPESRTTQSQFPQTGATEPTERPTPPPPPPGPPTDDRGRGSRTGLSLLITALVAALVAAVTGVGTALLVVDDTTANEPAADSATGETDGAEETTEEVSDEDQAGDTGDDAGGSPPVGEGDLTVSEVADTVAPSVAAVSVQAPTGQSGQGSAVIYDADGLLVTNNHVVEPAGSNGAISVQLADGTSYDAEVVGTDPTTDLAVLRVDATDLPAATFSDDLPDVGDTAVAIGSPFGLEGSVSSGIVSALDRTLSGPNATLTGLIQTDAAINPGNSGGALVNDQAEVIGINTAILSPSGANDGVGFAVPATTATDVAEQLVTTGSVERAVLGVSGRDIDPQVAEAFGLQAGSGALIVAVQQGSGAAEAGIQPGDIITTVEGETVESMADLAGVIREFDPGDEITVEGLREGEEFSVDVELGSD